ncbi:MAG: hypothetical protein JXB35_07655 [Anaerolineae bacterium]|nr:hypothetical protein [Anaerolineae bacterium]
MKTKPVSGCLLSTFLWIWVIGAGAGALTALAGVLGLPFYAQLKPDIPIPQWALYAYAVTFTAALISILGIILEKPWGLSGFVGTTLAIIAVEVSSGIPLAESVWILNNVTFLVVVLALDEYQMTSERELVEICRAGLAAEDREPRAALEAYRLLDATNVTYSLPLMFTGLLSLPLAYVIAYYVNLRIDCYQGVIVIALMCLLGIGPVVLLSVRRRKDKSEKRRTANVDIWQQRTPTWLSRLGSILEGVWIWGWMLLVLLFADVLQLAIMALIAGIVLIVVMLPVNLWQWVQTGPPLHWGIEALADPMGSYLSGAVFFLTFVVIASDVRLKPFSLGRILQEIPIGLRENSDKIFSFIANVALGFILLGTAVYHEVLYENLELGIIVYLFLGALIGWDHYREEQDQPLGILSILGQARCLVRLGQNAVARVKLERRLAEGGVDSHRRPKVFQQLAQAFYIYLAGYLPLHLARRQLREAADALDITTPHRELCESNARRIQELMDVPAARRLPR